MGDMAPRLPDAQAARRNRLRLALGLSLGVALLVWFLSRLQWRELGAVLAEVSLPWLGVAAVILLVDYALHALRWGVLLRHVDPDIDFRLLWSATAIGWAFNTLLPLRAGNFLRPAVVALKRRTSYTTLLFTTVAEYVCDAVGIVAMLLWMLWLLPPELLERGSLAQLKAWGSWAGLGALGLIALIVLLSSRQARSLVDGLLTPIPSPPLRARLLALFDQLVAGMAAVGHPVRLLQAVGVTLLYWGFWLLGILATLKAFQIELPLAGALFMEAALTLAMMVPQAPGFLGVFHVVTEEALSLWGTPTAQAQGIALVFWAVVFVPITVWGVVEGWRQGLDVFAGRRAVLRDLAAEEGLDLRD